MTIKRKRCEFEKVSGWKSTTVGKPGWKWSTERDPEKEAKRAEVRRSNITDAKKLKRETTQKHTTQLCAWTVHFIALNVKKKKKKNFTEMWCNNTTTSGED